MYVCGTVPAVLLIYGAFSNQLGPDPVKTIEHELGLYALKFLICVLLIRPLRRILNINLIKYRRALGLLSFWYVCVHFLTYIILDQQLYWSAIIKDLVKRPYIVLGFTSFIVLMLLAITSNNWSKKRLGAAGWRAIHILVYPATLLAVLHFVMLVKSWPIEPLAYLAIVFTLICYRFLSSKNNKSDRS